MRALVTGGNGFIGSHLVRRLRDKGYLVTCLVRETSDLKWLSRLEIDYVIGDCTRKETLYSAVEGANFIYHLAGVVRAVNRETYYLVNCSGTKNLLEACLEVKGNISKFVYLSSQSAVGPVNPDTDAPQPISDYGKSKLEAERVVMEYRDRLPTVIVRAPVIYGPRDRDVYTYFKLLKARLKPVPGNGEGKFNALYVEDLVDGIILAGESENSTGKIYFIAAEKSYSWEEASNLAEEVMGVHALRVNVPRWLIAGSAFVAEACSRIIGKPALIDTQKAKEILHNGWVCSIQRAKEDLGFLPRMSLKEGLRKTVEWYRENGWL